MIRFSLILFCLFLEICTVSATGPVKTGLLSTVPQYIRYESSPDAFCIAAGGKATSVYVSPDDWAGVVRAARDLGDDIRKVSGIPAQVVESDSPAPKSVIVGTIGKSPLINRLVSERKLDVSSVKGQWESFVIQTVDGNLVVAGSDKRGTIYGIYDISEKIGVSPWYWWADVPVRKSTSLYVKSGRYVQPSPKVKYRGIFLNDEAPCLSTWIKNTYGTDYGDHRFYTRVFELILRLKGNLLWPAMLTGAFYADDPLNSRTADEMGVIVGTSHHEPMARNHQEWVRGRKEYGAWDYATNQKVIDRFFREGIERIKDTEDLITVGMRGDGDTAMGGQEGRDHEYVPQDQRNMRLMEKIFKNQRNIIKDVTGMSPEKRPQVWAVYKEVQRFYDLGLRPADDVTILLCDDNWGNVRRLPDEEERKHPGGWGMYYHVNYVGAPRNSKWLNTTPIQNMWEQLRLTYDYGVERLWILNVGDLKPMEYPISLFLNMAWNPEAYHADNLLEHTRNFCAQAFGEGEADEAARILNLCCKYNGRCTPEMLDSATYNLETGEWRQVVGDYALLEAEALRQYIRLKPECRDAYKQLVLFPVQAMANLHEMYYAQAMNHKLYAEGNPEANGWADKVEKAFARDRQLCDDYNRTMAGGKWNGMMVQKHIGYTSWNDDFPADKLPEVRRIAGPDKIVGGYVFTGKDGYVAMEAEHCFSWNDAKDAEWTVIPYMGRTLSGMSLMPYTASTGGASVAYRMRLPEGVDSVTVHVVVKSTLAFHDPKGHEYTVGFEGGKMETVNFNHNLNEEPENIYTICYPTVARRVVEKVVPFKLPASEGGMQTLVFRPEDPGIVLEKIVVDYGGYKESYLFMDESPCRRIQNTINN